MKKFLQALAGFWFSSDVADFRKDQYGLTNTQRERILAMGRSGEEGRDMAERVACHGFGLRTSQFTNLMRSHGISVS